MSFVKDDRSEVEIIERASSACAPVIYLIWQTGQRYMALITIIEQDHQWFKSNQGMPADQAPRHLSFCGHAILSDMPLVIPDTHSDERFADNPYVTGNPGIRFYAGTPLRVHGRRVGTLCILDRKPRQLTPEEQDSLTDLAAVVAREMASIEMAIIDDLTGLANRRGFLMFCQVPSATAVKASLRACASASSNPSSTPIPRTRASSRKARAWA